MTLIRLADIKIGDRHRKDLGDIASLARSIEQLGLLHPVVVTPDSTLLCGRRRLEACKELGWEKVTANVVNLDDLLRAENDENVCRKDFTPSEAVEIGRTLVDRERAKAKERQREGRSEGGKTAGRGRPKQDGGNLPPSNGADTRDRVAEAVGMSGKTFEKAEAVVEAAEADPETFGDLPDVMDDKSVDAAFKEMKKRQEPERPPPAPPRHPHSDLLVKWLDLVHGTSAVIDINNGGIEAMLGERKKWDWKLVREFIVPQLDALGERLATYRQEIEEHEKQQR